VKRYGHQMKLNDQHIKEIAPLINLKVDDLFLHDKSDAHFIIRDEEFAYKHQHYDPHELLLIGFLYCQYSDPQTHLHDLWLIVCPKFEDKVPRKRILDTIVALFHIAVDQRLRKLLMGLDTE
jgi:hypothetical protein